MPGSRCFFPYLLVWALASLPCWAATDPGSQYEEAVDWAKGIPDQVHNRPGFSGFDPEAYCQDEACRQQLAHPDASEYDDSTIGPAAAQAMGQDPISGSVQHHYYNAPHIDLDQGVPPSLQRATKIMDNAYEISHGLPNPYTDCTGQGEQCTTTTTEQQCQAPNVKAMQCLVMPVVRGFESEEGTSHLGKSDKWFSRFTVKLPYKGLTIKHLKIANSCQDSSHLNTFSAAHLIGLTGNQNIDMQLGGLHSADLPVNTLVEGDSLELLFDRKIHLADFAITWQRDIANIEYRNTCGELSSHCRVTKKVCEEGENETRYIQGKPVTLPCWKERQDIQCGADGPNSCTPFENTCALITSDCARQAPDGWCEAFDNTYQCEQQSCSPESLICGEQSFCLNGDCYQPEPTQNDEFGEAGSALAGASQAGSEMTPEPITTFTGAGRQCDKKPLGFSNCCQDSGWGQGLGLDRCSDEEKELGAAKEKGLVIKLGEYCAEDVLGVCIRKKEGACMFNSKLSRIIQAQGRRDQLGISMGSGEHPDCRGLTPEELQQIDFSKIDFSEFYGDMEDNNQLPNPGDIQNQVQNQVPEGSR